ncbi:MAG: DUF86 domain-containing protein [Synergistaceae bacterium]|jgi:uncharacterized protein with HEPN domain|nr:DUF86 domain-containing protein [Synergistaceae bacterium]
MKNRRIIETVLNHIEKIENYVRDDSTYENFSADAMIVEACAFNLIQIGEQVNRLDEGFMNTYKDVQWTDIYNLRNRIVHDYQGINFVLIWQIIRDDLPLLKKRLREIADGSG